jgi:hypothetical protein
MGVKGPYRTFKRIHFCQRRKYPTGFLSLHPGVHSCALAYRRSAQFTSGSERGSIPTLSLIGSQSTELFTACWSSISPA